MYNGNGNLIYFIVVLLLKKFWGGIILGMMEDFLLDDFDDCNSLSVEYICEVWCGYEKGKMIVLNG